MRAQTRFNKQQWLGRNVKVQWPMTDEALTEAMVESCENLPYIPKGVRNWASKRSTEQ